MSFELTPLAKKVFLNDFKSSSSEAEQTKPSAQDNIFNIGYPCYQMPSFGYNFGPDLYSLFLVFKI